jgi:cell wall assembly regulator SMI1
MKKRAREIVLKEAKLEATGDVAARWKTISDFLKAEHPQVLAHFNPPASPDAIAEAEKQLGETLPDDYKQFLLIHNGQKEFAPMVGLGSLFSIEQVAQARLGIFGEEEPIDESKVDEGIRAVEYSEQWIPISKSARNRDYLCIDLNPAPSGARGQIIEYIVDFPARALVAKSFADLLSRYFREIQTGQIDVNKEVD